MPVQKIIPNRSHCHYNRAMRRQFSGLLVMLIAAGFVIAGVVWAVRTVVFVGKAAKTSGQVVVMERRRSGKRNYTYRPVFAFTDSAGLSHTGRTAVSSSYFSYQPGDRITVLYDPASPEKANIDSFQTVWLGPLVFTGGGLLFGAI